MFAFRASLFLEPLNFLNFSTLKPSTEQIVFLRANQIAGSTATGFVLESTHNANRRAIKLAADQARSASQLVGNGFVAGPKSVSMRIAFASIIKQRLHPCNPDCDLGQAFTPGAAKRIGDDDCDCGAHALTDL